MKHFEIIVIGGGIQGAGCAQAAAAAGYSVLLLEQERWGFGTSSRSSKLIHGGLRYLETFQFGLVRKSLAERKILRRIASTLVHPLPFFIPVYKSSRHQGWKVFAALSLYRLFAGADELANFRHLPQSEWHTLSGLNREGLKHVFQYWDTQTDDRLLTRAVAGSAAGLGATTREHARFIKATAENRSCTVTYSEKGAEHQATCRVLINAGGPWVAEVQTHISGAPPPPKIDLVKGSHIVLADKLHDGIFYLESPVDRRPMFIMPWQGNTLVGTTEKIFTGDPAAVSASDVEILYLLKAVAHYFPDFKCEVLESFAGLRVLTGWESSFSDRPRDTLIQYDDRGAPRIISLYGGKLTTYRATAESIIKKVAPTLGKREHPQDTSEIYLTCG
ncbi:MAG: FAD-dependent oxidoreductase [Proteobacteria bacterium]|nr:FAD-dependent oxidoreductase [Pseudomonadota bacterium]MBU1737436.1 FAD-dependent oxidoreductase [Pseudomonadota bacterium]